MPHATPGLDAGYAAAASFTVSTAPTVDRSWPWEPAALAVAAAALQIKPLRSLDLWWHLSQGRAVLESGARTYPEVVGLSDTPTYTNPEWLFDVLALGAWSLGGASLVTLAVAGAAAASAALSWHLAHWVSGHRSTATGIAALCLGATSWRFAPRPQAAFLVLLPMVMGLAWLGAHRPHRGGWAVALVCTLAAWTQLHSSMIIAPVVVAAVALTTEQAWRDRVWLTAVAIGGGLVLLGPFGLGIVDQVMGHAGSDAARHITDMRPMPLAAWWPLPGNSLFWLWSLVAVGAVGALSRARNIPVTLWVLPILGVAMTATAHRFRAAFAILLVPWAAALCPRPFPRWLSWGLLGVVPTVIAVRSADLGWPELDPTTVPVSGVSALAALDVSGPLFNTYEGGGYIGFARYRKNRVLIDGRTPVFFDDEHYFAYRVALRNLGVFTELHDRWDFQAALVPRTAPICEGLADTPEWTAVWFGESEALFVPVREHTQDVYPLDPCKTPTYTASCQDVADKAAHLQALRRTLQLTPEDPHLLYLGVQLALDCGPPNTGTAELLLQTAQAIAPHHRHAAWLAARLESDPERALELVVQAPSDHARARRLELDLRLELNQDALSAGLSLLEDLDDDAPAELRCQVAEAAEQAGRPELARQQRGRATLLGLDCPP